MPKIDYLCTRFLESMSNGVMVAQQVLVLFVVVRIRLGQQILFLKTNYYGKHFFFGR